VSPPRLRWTWKRFEALSLDELYDALALRCRVFILEQGPYQDPDGLDRVSWHLLGRDEAGALQAYLRVVDPKGQEALDAELEKASGRDVVSTPTFFFNGVKAKAGEMTLEGIDAAYAAALKARR
jgi:predicted GNAT family N-acyltransferase